MRLSKKIQKLMPYGRELILQGESTKDSHVKVAIRKRFDTQLALDDWLNKKREGIKAMLVSLETMIDR